MSITVATWIVSLLGLYAACGLLFAIPFVIKGIGSIDPVAKEGTWGFRVLVLPGVAAFWPLFARRLLVGVETPPIECNPHRTAARLTPKAKP
jgi:hypothetical protein